MKSGLKNKGLNYVSILEICFRGGVCWWSIFFFHFKTRPDICIKNYRVNLNFSWNPFQGKFYFCKISFKAQHLLCNYYLPPIMLQNVNYSSSEDRYLKVFSFAFSKLILSQHKVYWTLRAQASLCANGTRVLLLSFSKSPDWFIGSFSWKSLSACMTLQGKAGKAMTGFNALQDHWGHESTLLLYKVLSQRAFTLWSPYVSTNKRGSEGRTKSTKHPQDAAFPPTVGQCLRASHVTRGTCWWSHTIPASLFHTLTHRLHPFPHPQPQCSSTFSLIGMWGRRNRARGGGRLRPLWVFF